ncbi:MAG: hypothetical protein CMN04_03380 [Roseibacillus sp.]|nr:hypothetical protein [Roseibacillus sp.]|tara:strand:- start:9733 stop:10809 length:1077 start_codon:yes stop_codon:yes gene_type:complete
MNPVTSRALLSLLLLSSSSSLVAIPTTATLTAVNEQNFNRITLEFEPPVLPTGRDTTRLSGSIEVLLEIDPVTDRVSEMTILDGDVQGSAVELSGSTFLIGSYDLESSTLGATLDTPLPPGVVDPATGEFDSSQHTFTVSSGTLGGNIRIGLLGINENLDFDFTNEPVGGTGLGTGSVTLTPTTITPTSKAYNVDVQLPIAVDQVFEAAGVEVPIRAEGAAKLSGPATVQITPEDPFTLWATANGISGATPLEDSNEDGVSNGIQWALGLNASENPFPHLLQPGEVNAATVAFSLSLPKGGTASALLVTTGSDPLRPFSPVGPALISTGRNPIPAGTSGDVTIRIPRGQRGFIQLSTP